MTRGEPVKVILRLFGYTKVPREVSLLAARCRMKWQANSSDPEIGRGLDALEKFWRSTQ